MPVGVGRSFLDTLILVGNLRLGSKGGAKKQHTNLGLSASPTLMTVCSARLNVALIRLSLRRAAELGVLLSSLPAPPSRAATWTRVISNTWRGAGAGAERARGWYRGGGWGYKDVFFQG